MNEVNLQCGNLGRHRPTATPAKDQGQRSVTSKDRVEMDGGYRSTSHVDTVGKKPVYVST